MIRLLIFAGGAAVASAIAGLSVSGKLHKGAVVVTAAAMRLSDAVSTEAQNIADDASDARADELREARINAAVQERLAVEEARIRAEVAAELDAQAPQK